MLPRNYTLLALLKNSALVRRAGLALLPVALLLNGCGHDCPASGEGLGSTCGQSSTGSTGDTGSTSATDGGTGQLYTSSSSSNSISRFAGATALNGNYAPTAVISGASTQLDSPGFLLSDPTNDTLYVANAGNSSVLVFTNASTQTGSAPPARVLGGTGTLLSTPVALAIDSTRNLLYVANGNQSVEAFANASTVTSVVAPARVLAGSNTGFTAISSLVYDQNNDALYVIDSGASAIYAFDAASTLTGNTFPTRKLVGSATQLSSPEGAVLNGTSMFVSNGSGSILRFDGITTLNGAIAPAAVISGSATDLVSPMQLAYYSGFDGLFVNDPGGSDVLVFEGVSSASGAAPPNLILGGDATTLSAQSGMAVDFIH